MAVVYIDRACSATWHDVPGPHSVPCHAMPGIALSPVGRCGSAVATGERMREM